MVVRLQWIRDNTTDEEAIMVESAGMHHWAQVLLGAWVLWQQTGTTTLIA